MNVSVPATYVSEVTARDLGLLHEPMPAADPNGAKPEDAFQPIAKTDCKSEPGAGRKVPISGDTIGACVNCPTQARVAGRSPEPRER